MTLILLGIVSSVVAEIVTAINKKLSGTVLKGDAAFLLVFAISFVGAFVKEITMPGFTWAMLGDWQTLATTFGEIFTVSQVYFMFIMQKLNLDVQPEGTVVTATGVAKPETISDVEIRGETAAEKVVG